MNEPSARPSPAATVAAGLTHEEIARYSRHLTLPEVGIEGQRRLKAARVLCIGLGGLGSPVTMYLAAAGVGTLGLVDPDTVEHSNLQRQVLYGSAAVGRPKTAAARDRLADLNPNVHLELIAATFSAATAEEIVKDYDVVIDGTDNFPTRYLSNDVCVFQRKPNVYGSIFRFEGQCSVFAPHRGGPCYRCMFPEPPPPGMVPSCAEGGVLGVLPGLIGTLQAIETIKLLLGLGDPLLGRLLHFDALRLRFREFHLRRDPKCPVCGPDPTITAPIDYRRFCGLPAAETAPEEPVPSIAAVALKKRLDAGEQLLVIDVREPAEQAICRIPGSLLIPVGRLIAALANRGDPGCAPAGATGATGATRAAGDPRVALDGLGALGALDRAAPVVVHCKTGGRSARAVRHLRAAGFSGALNLEGGIEAWADTVDPSVPKY